MLSRMDLMNPKPKKCAPQVWMFFLNWLSPRRPRDTKSQIHEFFIMQWKPWEQLQAIA